MNNHYSDLQVVQRDENPKYLVSSISEPFQEGNVNDKYVTKYSTEGRALDSNQSQSSQKRICGLPVRRFWIVAAILSVVVIAAAVGGGVGATLSSKNSSKEADAVAKSTVTSAALSSPSATTSISSSAATSAISSETSTIPSSTTVIISTSTTQSAEYTLLVDCPSSNWTIYTPAGTTQKFRKVCQNAFLNQNGIDAVVNTPASDLDACIDLCAAYNVQYASQILSGANDVCNAVCWRDTITGNDWPGQCFGYSTRNSSSTFILTGDDRCAGASWINQ